MTRTIFHPPEWKQCTLTSFTNSTLHVSKLTWRIRRSSIVFNSICFKFYVVLITEMSPRNLRSAGKHLLEVPNVRLKSYGSRAFSVTAPKLWNEIPLDINLSRSVDVFKSRLKTYLFRLAFNWLFVLLLLLVRYLLDCKAI